VAVVKSPFSGPQRPDPAAPWTSEEVAARLEHVFEMCTAEYHFIPGEDDWTALRKACSLIRSVCQVVEAVESDLDHLSRHADEEMCRAIDLVRGWPNE
jgi:hypothetical protein